MPVGRAAKRRAADFSRDEHGQRRDGASSDRVAAAALLLSVGNMVRWALSFIIRFLRFAFFCRRRDPRLKNGEKGQKFACGAAYLRYAAAREMSGWSKGDRAESIGSQADRMRVRVTSRAYGLAACAAYGMNISKNSVTCHDV